MKLIKATFENLLHPGSFIRILFHSILFFSKSMQSLNTQMLPQDLSVPSQSACSIAPEQPCIFPHGSTIIFLSPKPQTSNLPPGPTIQQTLISSRQVFSFSVFGSLKLAWPFSSLASGLFMLLNASPHPITGATNQCYLQIFLASLSHTQCRQFTF